MPQLEGVIEQFQRVSHELDLVRGVLIDAGIEEVVDGWQRGANDLAAEAAKIVESVREEFVVCHAAGYPDPYKPTPNTLEEARRFRDKHRWNHSIGRPMDPQPVVKRRLISPWEDVQ